MNIQVITKLPSGNILSFDSSPANDAATTVDPLEATAATPRQSRLAFAVVLCFGALSLPLRRPGSRA
jgi:hypothetical protein